MFQIRTGGLLCILDIEERPFSLGGCAREDLVAVGLLLGRLKFIHVELPRRKESEREGITVMDLQAFAFSLLLFTIYIQLIMTVQIIIK